MGRNGEGRGGRGAAGRYLEVLELEIHGDEEGERREEGDEAEGSPLLHDER